MKSIKNLTGSIASLMVVAFLAVLTTMLFGIPLYFTGAVIVLLSLIPREKSLVFMAVSPDITNISNYFGKVKDGLFSKLYNSLDIANDITLVPNVKNKLKLTKLLINNGPEPYSGIFEPKANDIGYSGQDLEVDQWQRDLIVDPRKYRLTYLSDFRPSGEGTMNNVIPFQQYTYGKMLEALAASLNDTTSFNGVGAAAFAAFNSGSTYAAGAKVKITVGTKTQYFVAIASTNAGESPITTPAKWADANALAITIGLGTRIKTARDGGVIPAANIVSTGDLTSTSGVYKQAKSVFRALPDAVKSKGAMVYMPWNIWEFLVDDFEDKVGKFTETDGSGRVYLSGTNKKAEIKATTWQKGSKMIIATPKENLLMGTDLLSDFNEVNIIPDVYTLKMGIAGVLGFNFQDPEILAINDQN